jgi:polysaccharide export outer membrane protein
MRIIFLKGLIVGFLVLVLAGCTGQRSYSYLTTPEQEAYFKQHYTRNYSVLTYNLDTTNTPKPYRTTIYPGDQLTIRYLNAPPELLGLPAQEGNAIGEILLNYNVDAEGNIVVFLVGKVYVAGLSVFQAAEKLSKIFAVYYHNPLIEVSITSLRVFVFGNVGQPGVVNLRNQRTNLMEVLATVGGIPQTGRIRKVKIIRGGTENPQVIWVNVGNQLALLNPILYVQDQDIIVVETRGAQYFLQEAQPVIGGVSALTFLGTLIILFRR